MNAPASPDAPGILVIGYGNVLRGDDGAGPRVASALAATQPTVRAMAVHQLTPELAEPLARSRLAFFVDAYLANPGDPVNVRTLAPAARPEPLGHTGDPRCLLALAQALYGAHPAAWWVTVPGVCFELGEELSGEAEAAVALALARIGSLIQRTRCRLQSRKYRYKRSSGQDKSAR